MADNRRLKEGNLLCYLRSCLVFKKWKQAWVELYADSRLVVCEEKGDKPKFSVLLKDVIPYMAVGQVCDRMPVKRPDLPERHSVHHLLGIGEDPRADTVHWLLFSSDQDMESWFGEITKTLPKPPAPAPPPGNEPPPSYDNVNEKAPGGPMGMGQGQPGAPGQPGPGGNTVVVVQGQQDQGYDAFGGLATGMLLGTLAGYGMGSMFGGGIMGMGGYGMGGAFTSNETNVTNNYYGDQGGGDQGAADDGGADDGGYDGGDYGGGDFGGGDYGGDFGGGDFGGGDFGF